MHLNLKEQRKNLWALWGDHSRIYSMCHRAIYLSGKILRLCKSVSPVRQCNSTLWPLQLYEEIFWKTRFLSSFTLLTGVNEANHWCLNAKSQNRPCLPLFYLQDAVRQVLKLRLISQHLSFVLFMYSPCNKNHLRAQVNTTLRIKFFVQNP